MADEKNVVVVVLDVLGVRKRGMEKAVHAAVVAFCRSVLVMDPATDVALLAATAPSVPFLYRTPTTTNTTSLSDCHRVSVDVSVSAALAEISVDPSLSSLPPLAAALSRALCYIRSHRTAATAAGSNARVVCVHASPDGGCQYVAMMNAVFAAQREAVPIDALVLTEKDSPLLQQAAHITNGVYLRPSPMRQGPEALLQTMLCAFAPSMHARTALLAMPGLTEVDTRAACFCHGTPIEQGFVCSVCLSVFCKFSGVCATCGSRFWLPSVTPPPPPQRASPQPATATHP